MTLTIGRGEAARRTTLVLGTATADGRSYAALDASESVFVVSRYLAAELAPTPATFEPVAVEPSGDGTDEIPPAMMEQIRAQIGGQSEDP